MKLQESEKYSGNDLELYIFCCVLMIYFVEWNINRNIVKKNYIRHLLEGCSRNKTQVPFLSTDCSTKSSYEFFNNGDKVQILGTELNERNHIYNGTRSRIYSRNVCYCSVHNLLSSVSCQKQIEIKLNLCLCQEGVWWAGGKSPSIFNYALNVKINDQLDAPANLSSRIQPPMNLDSNWLISTDGQRVSTNRKNYTPTRNRNQCCMSTNSYNNKPTTISWYMFK